MTITEIAQKLNKLESALIFCHARPDGDTLSSAFGLYYAFKSQNKKVDIVCQDKIAAKFAKVFPFEPLREPPQKCSYDGFIAVDCATEELMGKPYSFFARQKRTFSIDHHKSNTRFAKENYITTLPACSLYVFNIIEQMGVKVDKNLANILLVGVLTDTGNFTHSDVDGESLAIASKILYCGADIGSIYDKIFRSRSKEKAALYAKVMSSIKYYYDDRLAIITLKREDLDYYGLELSDTDDFIDFPMTIESVDVAVSVFCQRENLFRISFRGKTVDVSEIASVFGGGGHTKASGAVLSGYYEDAIDKLVFTIGNYL